KRSQLAALLARTGTSALGRVPTRSCLFCEKPLLARTPRIAHCFTVMRNSVQWAGRVGESVHLLHRYRASNLAGIAGTEIQYRGCAGALAYCFGHLLVAGLPGPFKNSLPVTG